MKNRKLATQKQVYYANKIAYALEITEKFNLGASFYEVSNFIRKHEEEYRQCGYGKASIRQVDYANAISQTCYGCERFDKNSKSEEVSDFITQNKAEYAHILYRESIINKNSQEVIESNKKFTTETMLYLCDNLYKVSGIYAFIGENNTILYIGKSTDLSRRILSSYNCQKKHAKIIKIMCYAVNNIADTNVLEILLIVENNPILNEDCKTNDIPKMFHSGIDILRDFTEIPFKDLLEEAV